MGLFSRFSFGRISRGSSRIDLDVVVMAGLDPAIHTFATPKNVDARAFAAPKRLRPRRRDEPGHDSDRRWVKLSP
jgi:hypothetical protein